MRLLRPIPLSVLSMLYGSAVAIYGWNETALNLSLFCSGEPLRGANIGHGIAVAFFAGLAGAVVVAVVSNRQRLVAGVLLVGMAALGLAIAFVALDSATYVQQNRTCGMFSPATGTVSGHVANLYYAWSFAIALLVVQAARVLKQGPPAPRRASTSNQAGCRNHPRRTESSASSCACSPFVASSMLERSAPHA
jgi:NO-binding membrane sensor protein with MHYT domain